MSGRTKGSEAMPDHGQEEARHAAAARVLHAQRRRPSADAPAPQRRRRRRSGLFLLARLCAGVGVVMILVAASLILQAAVS